MSQAAAPRRVDGCLAPRRVLLLLPSFPARYCAEAAQGWRRARREGPGHFAGPDWAIIYLLGLHSDKGNLVKNKRVGVVAGSLLVGLLGTTATVQAQPQFGLNAGVQHFAEEEFVGGSSVVKEHGYQLNVGLTYDNLTRVGAGFVYSVDLLGYDGRVDYEGQTLGGAPIGSTTDYQGGRADFLFGHRFADTWSGYDTDLFAGIGTDYWERDLNDTSTSGGVKVRGYQERYTITYSRLGVGFYHKRGHWHQNLQLGFKIPLETNEVVDAFNARLKPGKQPSIFATLNLYQMVNQESRSMGVTLFYDGFRFKNSAPTSSTLGAVYQPKTNIDVFGIRLTKYF